MYRSIFVLAAAGLVAAACEPGPSAPNELTPVTPSFAKEGQPAHGNYRQHFARTVDNPCPPVPEPVAVEGYLHYNSHFKFFEGGNDSRIKTNSEASGVGLVTGVKYQFHELFTLEGRYTYANSRWETGRMTRFHVISQTGLGNFYSTVKWNVVCTPEGCTDTITDVETDCRG
jgi:hypothetical protein